MKSLKKYIESHNEIYLYGAGINAKVLFKTLQKLNKIPKGFIVSKSGSDSTLYDIPILSWDKAKNNISSTAGIIIAIREEWQGEIFTNLMDRDFFAVSDRVFAFLKGCSFKKTLQQLKKEVAPPIKIPPKEWRNILVVRLDAIGDMVWTTPFLRELRRNVSPEARITLINSKRTAALMQDCPYIDKSIPIDVPLKTWDVDPQFEQIKENMRLFCEKFLCDEHFDTVILPRFIMHGDSMEALLIAIYSGAKNRLIRQNNYESYTNIYQKELRELCSDVYTTTEVNPEVECMLDFLRYLDMNILDEKLELWVQDNALPYFYVDSNKIYIAVGLVASLQKRSWSPLYYAELFQKLEKKFLGKITFVLLGGKDALYARNELLCTDIYRECCLDLIGKTSIREVCSVIRQCSLYIGSDTGLLHIAVAEGKSIVALAPYSNINDTHESSIRRCEPWETQYIWITPEVKDSGNINKITPQQVYDAVLEML